MDPIKDTLSKVKKSLTRYGMINQGDLVIVGVSGGPDSVCLLDILYQLRDELNIRLIVAHYNHGLRKDEDESETRFVQELANALYLPFETEKTHLLSEGPNASLEERARNARYNFLERMKEKHGAQKIALGHNLNDQAETFLMRLLRGSGSSGLTGIPPCRDNVIIRPLIETKRAEIEAYLEARHLSFMMDSSNLDRRFLRNKIRLELLPSLLEYQPRLIEHLGQLADILREENAYLERVAQDWVERKAEPGPRGDILIPLSPFLNLSQPIRNRVTRHLIVRVCNTLRRIDQHHIDAVHSLALGRRPQGMISLPNGLTVKRIYDKLSFRIAMKQKPWAFRYVLGGPGTFHFEEIGRTISLAELDGSADMNLGNSRQIAYLDAGKIKYPLILRNFRPGDRFIPLGMTGHRKIKDFFIDLKIPSEERALIPILINQNTPAWICGLRIDDRFKVTPETKRILKIMIA